MLGPNQKSIYEDYRMLNHTIIVTQLSGYLFTPTIKTYSINSSCGQTTTLAFPN